ncbi:MAG: gliding motility-associated C-terminal domain-containing protein, partial [Paludibacteraceae bacterium]
YDKAIVRLTKPIEVKLNVTHEYGCSGETSTLVLIDPDFEVPNTMTQEDEFMADYELQIFDRIGNLIYEGIGWHGQKNNGEEAFSDTYFYAITYYAGGEKKIKTGYITLVR